MRLITLPLLTALILFAGCSIQQEKPIEPAAVPVPEEATPNVYTRLSRNDGNREDQIQIGRYTTASATATIEQEDLLEVIIKTKIPNSIQTVGDGVNFLLLRSGYTLASKLAQGKDVEQLLSRPIPYAHRSIGPMTLKRALLVLVGDAFWMKVDPVHRLIAFDTVEEYR